MKRVLSTKRLTIAQKELLLNAGFSFVEYNAIEIVPLDFNVPAQINNAIFTSGNAVDVLVQKGLERTKIEKVFCVGTKTAQKLTDLGQNVIKTAKNASELGDFIKNSFKNEDFHFFSGSLRMNELPDRIKSSENRLFELKTYKTVLKSKKFDQKFEGIMFFSPSGVASIAQENDLSDSLVFCIGETTASEARKYTPNVHVANQPTVESVIAKTVTILRAND